MFKKLLVILTSTLMLTMYGCSSKVEEKKVVTPDTIPKEVSKVLPNNKNSKIHTVFLKTITQSENSTKEDYIKILNTWIKNNSNKKVISLTNYPAQGEVYGLFITYSDELPTVKYNIIAYDSTEFKNSNLYKEETFTENHDIENNINFVCSYSEGLNIVTETTINDWRGGVKYLLLIVTQ